MKNKIIFACFIAVVAAMGFMMATCELDTRERVIVTFEDPNGGNSYSPLTVVLGEGMGRDMPTPERSGPFGFYGWYDNANRYDADTPVMANVTLTARWEDDICTVSFAFAAIEPTAEVLPVTAIRGVPLGVTGFPATPRSQGYEFAYWWLEDEYSPFYPDTPVSSDITLTAHWEPKTAYTIIFEGGPGGPASIPSLTVYENECIDEWEPRFYEKKNLLASHANTTNGQAFFVAFFDEENREYDGRVVITPSMVDGQNRLTVTAKWGLPPYYVKLWDMTEQKDFVSKNLKGEPILNDEGAPESEGNFRGDIKSVDNNTALDSGVDIDYKAVAKEAWDSTAANPIYVTVNERMYDLPDNTNRWRIIYRVAFEFPESFDVGYYTRYTVRARFYGNKQAVKGYPIPAGAFTPNNLIETDTPASLEYGASSLLKGTNEDSKSDDGWGQISWTGVANWNGGGADEETMIQRYNLDRKGGTINDTWAPLRYKTERYPPYLIVQTSDAYIGHIEIYQIVFHNGEVTHTLYEGEEPPVLDEDAM